MLTRDKLSSPGCAGCLTVDFLNSLVQSCLCVLQGLFRLPPPSLQTSIELYEDCLEGTAEVLYARIGLSTRLRGTSLDIGDEGAETAKGLAAALERLAQLRELLFKSLASSPAI